MLYSGYHAVLAKSIGQKKRLRTLKDLDRAALLLAHGHARYYLDENTDEAALRQAIFRRIPKDKLAESVGKVNELARLAGYSLSG